MKNVKLRINTDFIINATGAAIFIIAGIFVIIASFSAVAELSEYLDISSLSNDAETLIAFFLYPLLIAVYGVFFVFAAVLGLLPAAIGLTTGVLSSIARFLYTENGTTITRGYKTMMTIAYIINITSFILYIAGFICINNLS